MNIPDKTRIIERIKSLLSLGDSSRNPYEEEVKTALVMAQKMMKKYNLTISEIDFKNSSDDKIGRVQTSKEGHLEPWKHKLAKVIKILYNVEPIIQPVYNHRRCWLFIGFQLDCELAKYTYDYLEDLIDFRSKLKYKGRRLQRLAYLQGFLQCLLDRAEAEKAKIETSEDIKYGSLVIVKSDRIDKWISENLKTTQEHRNQEMNLEDMIEYNEGYSDAKKIKLGNKKEIK
jgi:hypothetical protein